MEFEFAYVYIIEIHQNGLFHYVIQIQSIDVRYFLTALHTKV